MPPRQDQPLYAQIAADLRERIADGRLAEGAKIPGEKALSDDWGTTRPTVRQALDVLRQEGLIAVRPGLGRFVRRQPALSLRSSTHYRRMGTEGPTSPFQRDAEREGKRGTWGEPDSVRVRADDRVAARLEIEPGDFVMRTEYVFMADDAPVQSSTSWEPWAVTGGTAIEEAERGPVRGVVARMDSIGVHIDQVTERVISRPATADERRVLQIPDEVWVLNLKRTYRAGDTPVETCDIVIPADRYQLEYVIPIE